nr:hypothetical protein [Hoyosella altamirensis]
MEHGSRARLLRQYNLTRKTVSPWLVARDRGDFDARVTPGKPRRARSTMNDSERAELARLRSENAALKKKVAQSGAAQEILGKAFELLSGINDSSTDPKDMVPPAMMKAKAYRQWLARHDLS